MRVQVELYGIARVRAGTAVTTAEGSCLGEVLRDLARRYPSLAVCCVEDDHLRPGFTANLNGARFVTAPETPLQEGDTLLLLSADAGG